MTREKAIEILNTIHKDYAIWQAKHGTSTIETMQALSLAIRALREPERERGEWVGTADGYADGDLVYDMWECSECGYDADGAEEKPEWNFCPACGADMRPEGGADREN